MKRPLSVFSSETSLSEAKQRRVSCATFSKWRVDHDQEWQTDVAVLHFSGGARQEISVGIVL